MEKYLGGEELSPAEILEGLKKAVPARKLIPVLTGSALLGIGVTQLMDAVAGYLPSPLQRTIGRG